MPCRALVAVFGYGAYHRAAFTSVKLFYATCVNDDGHGDVDIRSAESLAESRALVEWVEVARSRIFLAFECVPELYAQVKLYAIF